MEKKTAKAGGSKAGTNAAVKTEEVKAVAEETKAQVPAEETKAPVKETKAQAPEEKTTAAPEKKEADETAKPKAKRGPKPGSKNARKPSEKAELKPGVVLQFQGGETTVDEAIEKIKAQFVSEGHRVSTIKDLQVYLKPEEYAAYYVINQKFAGRIDLF